MPTSTPRIGLTLPIASETMNLGDNQLAENYADIDDAIGVSAGTSFPLTPFTGQIFRRTDLAETYFWNGSTWVEWGAAAVPLINGVVGAATSTTQGATGTTEALAVSTSFSAVQNRRYLIRATLDLFFTGAVEGFFRTTLRWGTSVPTGASTLIREFRGFQDGANTSGRTVTVEGELAYTAISQTIHIGHLYRSESANNVNVDGVANPFQLRNTINVYDYGAV